MQLGESKEARRSYLGKVLEELCDTIGVHDAGSVGDERSAELLDRELSRCCDSVERHAFSFDRWVLRAPARLVAGGREVECYPYYGSSSPPEGALEGRVRGAEGAGSGHALIVRDAAGRANARLVPGPFGPAVPRFDPATTGDGLPTVGISREEAERLDSTAKGEHLSLRFQAELVRDARTENLVGTVAGRTSEELLLIAHRDSQYNSPGANDNVATVVTMLLIAAHFKRRRPLYTMRFLASGAEEIGCIGAHEYAARRVRDGTIKHIGLCLNFDSLTYGPDPHISSRDDRLSSLLADAYRGSEATAHPVLIREADTLDGAPFAERGIPAVYVNTRGSDAALRFWHRPEDRAGAVDPDLVEHSYSSIIRFVDQLEREGL